MSDLINFDFENKDLRTVLINNDPWFCVKDILNCMDSSTKVSDACKSLIEQLGDEVVCDYHVSDSLNREQLMKFTSESGFTFLVAQSRTESGKRLNIKIHKEILPSIRKTGKYELEKKTNLEILLEQVQELVRIEKEQKRLAIEQAEIKEDVRELVVTTNVLENNVEEINGQIDGINSELQRQHSPYGDYFTAMGFLRLIGFNNPDLRIAQKIGKKASKLCEDSEIEIHKVKDPRFGYVNSYPEEILKTIWQEETN